MKHGPNMIQANANARPLSFAEFRTESDKQFLDVGPRNI